MFRQLQTRALSAVAGHVVDSINAVAVTVAHELKAAGAVTEAIETQLLSVRWRTQLAHVQPLVALIRARSDRRSVADLALDCYSAYLDHRLALLGQVVTAKMQSLIPDRDLLSLVGRV